MITSIPQTHITPNPWQTRASLDEVHIRDLAIDIAARKASRPDTLGLLQLPAGRLIAPDGEQVHPTAPDQVAHYLGAGCTVQLAYGHNRAAAVRLLAQGDPDAFDPDDDYLNLILTLVQFTDEEMATSAWSENHDRQDLTSIEQAWAIQRMMDSFDWTQTQVAQRLGLARSTVVNKLRLLRLPNDVQVALKNRQITERQAAALLPVINLPAPALAQVMDSPYSTKPAELLELAIDGYSSARLREIVTQTISYGSRSFTWGLGAPFPLDHWFDSDDQSSATHPDPITGLQSHQCSECPIRVKHNKELHCPDPACWELKATLWVNHRLTAAEAATGLPRLALDDGLTYYSQVQPFHRAEITALAQQITEREQGCPHNRLRLNHHQNHNTGGLYLPDLDDVRIVCHHGDGAHCKCLAALKSTATRQRKDDDPETQARRQLKQAVNKLVNPAIEALADALTRQHQGAWRLLLKRLNSTHGSNTADWSLEKITKKIAYETMNPKLEWTRDKPQATQAHIEKDFDLAGLPLPWATPDPYVAIQRHLERMENWLSNLTAPPEPPASAGNLVTLQKLLDDLTPLPVSEQRSALLKRIVALQNILNVTNEPLTDNDTADGLTYKQGADLHNVPWQAIASIDEIMTGTSLMAQMCLRVYSAPHQLLDAIQMLACQYEKDVPAICDDITPDLIQALMTIKPQSTHSENPALQETT